LADSAVVGGGVGAQSISRRRQYSHKISPAHDTDELAILDDRDPLDPFGFE